MLRLNVFRLVKVLRLLASFDQINGPKYLTECFPKRTVSNVGKSKSSFIERVLCVFKIEQIGDIFGYKSMLDFIISLAMSCERVLYSVGSLCWYEGFSNTLLFFLGLDIEIKEFWARIRCSLQGHRSKL